MIRILVVDDSAIVRRLLTTNLSREPDFEVVGSAVDPYVARDRILQLKPDVLTLDIEMPRMDGLSFLERLMQHHPMPVVIVSSLAPANSEAALRALALGAAEIVAKPTNQYSAPDVQAGLARAIRAAAAAKSRLKPIAAQPVVQRGVTGLRTTDKLIVIGASTGGTSAVEHVLRGLPPNVPGTIVVQHMPVGMTAPFAARLQSLTSLVVREARDGDRLSPGMVLVAPAGVHTSVKRSGAQMIVKIKDGPRIHHQKPAVDVLFHSVATEAGPNAVGVLLTGMGEDGASGLLAMKDAGAHTIAQSEETCVVYGMPRAAVERGAAVRIAHLEHVADAIMEACSHSSAAASKTRLSDSTSRSSE